MGERPASVDEPASEAIATTAPFLNFAAVIAIVLSLASWGLSEPVLATAAGVSAVLAFAASIVCFRSQADDPQPAV